MTENITPECNKSQLNGKPLHNQFVDFDTKECLFCYAFKAAYERGKGEADLFIQRVRELATEWFEEKFDSSDAIPSQCMAYEEAGELLLKTLDGITESPCADGDTCKRINGRIIHDRFCNQINHSDKE